MITIKILGTGCANCRKLEEVARTAVGLLNVEAEVVKVTNMQEIVASGVLRTPGLMINGKLVSSGRIPAPASVAEWIQAAPAIDASDRRPAA